MADEGSLDEVIMGLTHMIKQKSTFEQEQTMANLMGYLQRHTKMHPLRTIAYVRNMLIKLNLNKKVEQQLKFENELINTNTAPPAKVYNGIEIGTNLSFVSDSDEEPVVEDNLFEKHTRENKGSEQASVTKILSKFDKRQPLALQDNDEIEFCKKVSYGKGVALPKMKGETEDRTKLTVIDKLITEPRINTLSIEISQMPALQQLVLQNTNIGDVFFAKLLKSIHSSAMFFKSLSYKG